MYHRPVLPVLHRNSTLTWWRHQMETFSALLAICAENSPVPGEFSTQRPVTRSFDVYFDLQPNKGLSKQLWGWWFETQACPLWHRNGPGNTLTLLSWQPNDFVIGHLPLCMLTKWRRDITLFNIAQENTIKNMYFKGFPNLVRQISINAVLSPVSLYFHYWFSSSKLSCPLYLRCYVSCPIILTTDTWYCLEFYPVCLVFILHAYFFLESPILSSSY